MSLPTILCLVTWAILVTSELTCVVVSAALRRDGSFLERFKKAADNEDKLKQEAALAR